MCDTQAPDELNLSLPDVQNGDAVFIFASEDTADYGEGMPDLKIGPKGLKIVANFMVFDGFIFDFEEILAPDFEYAKYTLGDEPGSVNIDVPSMGYPGEFNLQVFILRGDNFDEFVFSEMDTITRGPEGCAGDVPVVKGLTGQVARIQVVRLTGQEQVAQILVAAVMLTVVMPVAAAVLTVVA